MQALTATSEEMWSRGGEALTFLMSTGNRREQRLFPSAYQSPTSAVTQTELLSHPFRHFKIRYHDLS